VRRPLVAVALVSAALIGSALGGCALAPTPAAPPAQLEAASLGLSMTATPALPAHWWQAFGDPQLDALVERATRDSPSLNEALARLERAQADARAAGSVLEPRVDAAGTVVRERYSARYIIPPPYAGTSAWDSQLSLGIGWQLDFWGRQRAVIRAAERTAAARAFDARAAQLALEGAVVGRYLELERSHALADIAADAEHTREQVFELTRRRVAAGLDTEVELRTAAALLPEARVARGEARVATELAVHQLAALTGQGALAYAQLSRPQLSDADAPALPAVLPADLLLRRPDVQAALARVDAASAAVDVAQLASYPDINLRAFAGFAALSLSDLLSAPARTYGAGPALSLPIFDAGLLRERLHGAGADLEAAVAQYDATVLNAVREVADELTRLAALERQLQDHQQRLDLVSDAGRLVEKRYAAGIANQLAVLDAHARVLAARGVLVNTRALARTSRAALTVALGGGTEAAAAAAPVPTASAQAAP